MYSCPACGAEEVASRTTCLCGADLAPLQRLDGMADAWFNRALESLAVGQTGRALEWLSASCAARPTDAAARRAQARIWAQLGLWQEARDALQRAADIDPDAPELADLQAALQDPKADKVKIAFATPTAALKPQRKRSAIQSVKKSKARKRVK